MPAAKAGGSTASNASGEKVASGGDKGGGGGGSRSRQVSRNSGAGVGNSSRGAGRGTGEGGNGGAPRVIVNGKDMTPQELGGRPKTALEASLDDIVASAVAGTFSPPGAPGGRGGMKPGSIKAPPPVEDGGPLSPSSPSPSHRKGKDGNTPMSNKRESFAINRQASALGAGGHHHHKGPHLPPGMTLEDLDKPVSFTLTESPTVTLLHIPSICVHKDFAGMDAIKAKNDRYLALKDSKVGSDKYSERASQTINLPLKDKQSITDTVPTREVGCSAEGFLIADEYAEIAAESERIALYSASSSSSSSSSPSSSSSSSSSSSTAAADAPPPPTLEGAASSSDVQGGEEAKGEASSGGSGSDGVLDLSGAAPLPKNATTLERAVAETVLVALSSEGCLLPTNEALNQYGVSRTG